MVNDFRCPFCPFAVEVSEEDQDASFSEILSHIRWRHPEEDQTPERLWPRISGAGPVEWVSR